MRYYLLVIEKRQQSGDVVRVLIAIAVGLVGCVPFAYLMTWETALVFNKMYPHDGQNGLGAFFVGLLALPVGFFSLFFIAMALQKNMKMRREQKSAKAGNATKAYDY